MALCPDSHHLVYTIAFDPPGSPGNRMMAKMLASSLLPTYFGGDIMVFRNSPEPMFRVERKGLEEVYIETPQLGGLEGAEDAWCWKYRVRQFIDAERYDKILFLDADCLALRNLDHLLEGEWDLAYQTKKGLNISLPQFSAFLTDEEMATLKRHGLNSGHLAVRGSIFQEVMAEWERIDSGPVSQARHCLEQGSWNTEVFRQETARKESRNTFATPTPCTDGQRIYAVFGSGRIAAVDFSGKVEWTFRDFRFYSRHGLSASPVLEDGLLVMPWDWSTDPAQEGADQEKVGWKIPRDRSYVFALHAATGQLAWKTGRGSSRIAHITPNVWTDETGRKQLISGAGGVLQGFDLTTGKRLWSDPNGARLSAPVFKPQ